MTKAAASGYLECEDSGSPRLHPRLENAVMVRTGFGSGRVKLMSIAASVALLASATLSTASAAHRHPIRPTALWKPDQYIGVSFPDKNHGFVVADKKQVSYLLSTSDGGRSWHRYRIGFPPFEAIQFLNYARGWALGGPPIHCRRTCYDYIYRTDNGGRTWKRELRLSRNNVDAFQFVNLQTGWILDSTCPTCNERVLMTTNGGYSWHASRWGLQQVGAFRFLTSKIGWAVTYGLRGRQPVAASVFMTTDGGHKWVRRLTMPVFEMWPAFANRWDGWVLTSKTGRCARAGCVLQFRETFNGGKTWPRRYNLRERPAGFGGFPESMLFPDQRHGWLVLNAGAGPNGGGVATSINGGLSWHRVKALVCYRNLISTSVAVVGGTEGWVAGGDLRRCPQSQAGLVETTNGGYRWTSIHPRFTTPAGHRHPIRPTALWKPDQYIGVSFPDKNHGFVVADKKQVSYLLSTSDGGRSWHRYRIGFPPFEAIQFLNYARGWALGGPPIHCRRTCYDYIYRTDNGGRTWKRELRLSRNNVDAFQFVNLQTGWILDSTCPTCNERVLMTTNGGYSWHASRWGLQQVGAFRFLTSKIGWAVTYGLRGRQPVAASVFMTSDGGHKWVRRLTMPVFEMWPAFANRWDGWVLTSKTGRCARAGCVLQFRETFNGGKTWPRRYNLRERPAGFGGFPESMLFPDQRHGWLVLNAGAGPNGGGVATSINGGLSWHRVKALVCYRNLISTSVAVVGGTEGWVAGGDLRRCPQSQAGLVETTNGGYRWTSIHPRFTTPAGHRHPIRPTALWKPDQYIGVSFPDKNHGFVVADKKQVSYLLSTSDGGRSWHRYRIGFPPFEAIQFLNYARGWALGGRPIHCRRTCYDYIYRTDNGGRTWKRELRLSRNNVDAFQFVNLQTGWILDSTCPTCNERVLMTTNGGYSWHASRWGLQQVGAFRFLTSKIGWAVTYGLRGRQPVAASVFMTSDGGHKWVRRLTMPVFEMWPAFANRWDGWVLTSKTGRCARAGCVLQFRETFNGGKTWPRRYNLRERPAGFGGFPESMLFPDQRHGWLVLNAGAGPNGGGVATSINGGLSWHRVKALVCYRNLISTSVAVVGGTEGWVAGGDLRRCPQSQAGLVETTNGGYRWTSIHPRFTTPAGHRHPIRPTALWKPDQYIGVSFPDKNHGFVVADKKQVSYLLSTSDGGRSWHRYRIGFPPFEAIQFLNYARGWALGGPPIHCRRTCYDYIYRTDNGGRTWKRELRLSRNNVDAFQFVNLQTGWILDSTCPTCNERGLMTTYGGYSWHASRWGLQQVGAFRFLTSKIGWAVTYGLRGRQPVAASVFMTTDGGHKWVRRLTMPVFEMWPAFANRWDGWVLTSKTGRCARAGCVLQFRETFNGGKTWPRRYNLRERPAGFGGFPESMLFPDQRHGWLVLNAGAGPNGGGVATSINGGLSWHRVKALVCYRNLISTSVAVVGGTEGWVAGGDLRRCPQSQAGLVETTNGGYRWTSIHPRFTTPAGHRHPIRPTALWKPDQYIGVSFPDKNHGFVVADKKQVSYLLSTSDG